MRKGINIARIMVVCAVFLSAGPLTTPSIAQDEIAVGSCMAMSGYFTFNKEIGAGLTDAFALVNEDGGINGKKIKFILKDRRHEIDVEKRTLKSLLGGKHPLVFFTGPDMTKVLAPQIGKKYKILLGAGSMDSKFAQPSIFPGVFVYGPTYKDQLEILLRYVAREKRGAKIALCYSDTAFGRSPIKYARIRSKKLGLKLVCDIPLSLPSFFKGKVGPKVDKLAEAGPDFVLIHGFTGILTAKLIRSCRAKGMKCLFLGTFFETTKKVLDRLGPLSKGYFGVSPYAYWWMDDVPMIRRLKAYTAKHYLDPVVSYRTSLYMWGVAGALLASEALRRADGVGDLSYQGLLKGLQSIKDLDTGGLTGKLTFKDNRFPVATVYKASPDKGIFEPVNGWRDFKLE